MRTCAIHLGIVVMTLAAGLSTSAVAQDDLAAGFRDPPSSAKPHTWWHWMNGNISKEGITADLEAMKQIGLGGAQIFNVSESIPLGPIKFMSPEWLALVHHAANEADRLHLELCMHNCSGWSSSGGPWVTPEHAMQMITAADTTVEGPKHFDAALPMPPIPANFFGAIAALAFPPPPPPPSPLAENFYGDIAFLAFPPPADPAFRIADIKFKAGFDSRYNQYPSAD